MRRGVTLAELLLALAIIGILAAALWSAAGACLRLARRTACAGTLRQLGLACTAYASDWDGRLPAEGNCGIDDPARSPAWFHRLPDFLDLPGSRARALQCPAWRGLVPEIFTAATPKSLKWNSYLDNGGRPRHFALGRPGTLVLLIDAVAGETGMGQWGHATASAVEVARHPPSANWLASDGATLHRAETPADGEWADALPWKDPTW